MHSLQGKLITLVCAVILTNGVLSNVDPFSVCSRACNACFCQPIGPPTKCSVRDSENQLLPHENCNQFYICNHGTKVTFDCYGDLVFNPATGLCDNAHNVDCGDRVIPRQEDKNESFVNDNIGENSVENDDRYQDVNNDNQEINDNKDTYNYSLAEAPSICSAQGSCGTLLAHENCHQYYVRENGVPIAKSCPTGLLYNPHIQTCDWIHNVQCGDRIIVNENNNNNTGVNNICNSNSGGAPAICSVAGSDGTLLAHEICTKFYICDDGVPTNMTCPKGLLYNPCVEQCDWPHNVECGDRVIVEEEEEDNNGSWETITENGTGDNDNNGGNGTCNCNPGEAPLICSVDGSNGTLIAHEICSNFYVCRNGVPVAQSCPNGLLYNPYTTQCDGPQNVDCGDRVIVEEDDNDNLETNSTENGNGDNDTIGGNSTCNCNPAEAPAICSVGGSNGTLIAHEICNNFYVCLNDVPVAESCPNGLLYNPYTTQCDGPQNVDCGDRVIVGEDDNDNLDTSTENGNGDNDTVGGNSTCNCNPAEAPAICSVGGSNGTLIAHEICSNFYVCRNGIPVAQSCPNGLLYNPYTTQCDGPQNVDCGDRVIVEEDDNDNLETNSTENGNGDNDTIGGNSTCNCNPAEAPAICSVGGSNGTLIAHEICNNFYVCLNGVPVAQSCPNGLLYNPYTTQCDVPQNVDCGDRVIVEEDDNDSLETNSIENGNGDNDTIGGNSTCNCNPAEAPAICSVGGSNGTLIAHEICSNFYVCRNGVPVAQSCPNGLLYNPYTTQCDGPLNVDCGDRVIVEEDDNDSLETNSTENGNGDNDTIGGNSTCNCNPAEAPAICSVGGSNGNLIAHENCSNFYVCRNGVPVALSCPLGLMYNPYTEQCDSPHNVDCDNRVGIDEQDSSEENSNGDEGDDETSEPEDDLLEIAQATCANFGSKGRKLAHRNCHQFYLCLKRRPIVKSCRRGRLYEPERRSCDRPRNVQCGSRIQ